MRCCTEPLKSVSLQQRVNEMIELSTEAAMGPLVVKITGPLIRVVGERAAPDVKAAILRTFYLLLQKVPIHLKPFIAHLKTTFTKALFDENEEVREPGSDGLIELVKHLKTISSTVLEMVGALEEKSDNSTRLSILKTLSSILDQADVCNAMVDSKNKKLDEKTAISILEATWRILGDSRETIRYWSGRCIGSCLQYASEDFFAEYYIRLVNSSSHSDDWQMQEGMMIALNVFLNASPEKLDQEFHEETADFICDRLESDTLAVLQKTIVTTELLAVLNGVNESKGLEPVLTKLCSLLNSPTPEIRLWALQAIDHLAQRSPDAVCGNAPSLIKDLMLRAADSDSSVKHAALNAMYFVLRMDYDNFSQAIIERCTKVLGAAENVKFVNFCKKTLSGYEVERLSFAGLEPAHEAYEENPDSEGEEHD